MGYMENYEKWLNSPIFDEKTKDELKSIAKNKKEIEDRFYKKLDFGTGGLRGIIGAGDNRMNVYTVRLSTQGLANYILKQRPNKKNSVAIAYDSRHMSPEFAETTALVLNANGIKTYIYDSLRSTPQLSFAIRHLSCTAGVVVTASHNPPEYNGYKVYWEDGAQVTAPDDFKIIEEVKNMDYDKIKIIDKITAIKNSLFFTIGKEVDSIYYKEVLKQIVAKDVIEKTKDLLNIVYTPIHGTGLVPVKEVLTLAGFNNLHIVKEQEKPDPNFTTVGYPNPENPDVFKLAIKLGHTVSADLIVGTDPDADRVGAVVKSNNGEYVVLSGNQTGIIITEYLLSQKKLTSKDAIISTIVSTNLTQEITKAYNCHYFETLTGFKFIGEQIKQFDLDKSFNFLFGFEESFGSLAGTYARDKDAIVTTLLLCEIAGFYKLKGMTLYDALTDIYKKYGFYKETIESITLKGKDGIESINKILTSFRDEQPTSINNCKVIEIKDFSIQKGFNPITRDFFDIDLPKSNVLYYTLEDGSWFCVRPSGTEPKIKIYFGVKESTDKLATDKLKTLVSSVLKVIDGYR